MATLSCPYCPLNESRLIEDHHSGDLICNGCGLVIGDRIVHVGPEWRRFHNDSVSMSASDSGSRSRVGAQENVLYDSILNIGTSIARNSNRRGISPLSPRRYSNRKCLTSMQRTLTCTFKDIADMADKLNTSGSVAQYAQFIFKTIKQNQSLRGRSNTTMAAACLYLSMRKHNVPRTFKEICAVSCESKKHIGQCYKAIVKVIQQQQQKQLIQNNLNDQPQPNHHQGPISQICLEDYISRFVSALQLPHAFENQVRKLVKNIQTESLLSGRNPSTVIALCILLAMQTEQIIRQNNTKQFNDAIRSISEVTGASQATIRQVYQIIQQDHQHLLMVNN